MLGMGCLEMYALLGCLCFPFSPLPVGTASGQVRRDGISRLRSFGRKNEMIGSTVQQSDWSCLGKEWKVDPSQCHLDS